MSDTLVEDTYANFIDVARRRRSVRKFEAGREVSKETLSKIAEAGRWAPSGANVQPWDFIIVDDADVRQQVIEVFLRQANRIKQFAKGFPAVYKTYLSNTVAIFIVLGDERWTENFPQGTTTESKFEYEANTDNIFYSSIGAAIQNIQLAVTAVGLTSAWLSGGGEPQTNSELCELLGYPKNLKAYGTIPIGYPSKDVTSRYRRPVEQLVHWNRYEPTQYRTKAQLTYYNEVLRPFAMYRNEEDLETWEDVDERLGEWKTAFTTGVCNPDGEFDD